MSKCDGRTVVWREKRERYDPGCVVNRSSNSRNGIMFWGCIGFHGVGELIEVEQTFNSINYVDMLQEGLPQSIENSFGDRRQNFIFQQDNAPCHSSRYTQTWIEAQNFQTLSWPSNSPDMNIIETVWGHIGRKLREDPPLTVTELRHKVHRIWNSLSAEYLQSLYAQLQTRVQTLIDKRGYPTKF